MTVLSKKPLDVFKYTYAMCLLIFSLVIVMALVFTRQTSLSQDSHPAVAFVVCWITLIWLGMVEGGQCSLVGLPPVNPDLYKESHPLTHKICVWGHKGDNLDRYLMGRQFLVVLVVFLINLSCAPLGGATVFGFPDVVITIFLNTGIAMILFTTQIGQLAAQCNASHMMLDYINNYFMLFTMYVCMAIEFSGLLHSSYLVQLAVAKLAGKPIVSNEPPRTGLQSLFFWTRCLVSLAILSYAFAITLTALFQGKTTVWSGVPPGLSVVVFFILMSLIGLLEGMQIAFFAVTKMTKDQQGDSKCAKMTCDLLFKGKGRNLPGFMIGRQLCVTLCFFIIARVTTLDVSIGVDQNIFGVSDGIQEFFNTGLLGALITTILGSIAWQLVASAFPIGFLSIPLTYALLVFCLALEATGIVSGAWVVAKINRKLRGIKRDEEYIGTPEERAAKEKGDKDEELAVGAGHPRIPIKQAGSQEYDLKNVDPQENS